MGNSDILINVLLDRSGSMGGLETDVINQFNSYIESQRELPGKALVSLVLFDDRYQEVYIGRDIREVPKLNKDAYYVRGSTALIDALARLIKSVDAIKDKPSKVVFVINTDGYENASHEFTKHWLKETIEERKNNHDWQFVFVGAGIDAFAEANTYGIGRGQTLTVSANSAGINTGYFSLTNATTNYRSGISSVMDMSNADTNVVVPDTTVDNTTSKKKRGSKNTTP